MACSLAKPGENLALFLAALFEGERGRGFQRFECGQRCGLVAPDLRRLGPTSRKNRSVLRCRPQLLILLAGLANRLARDFARKPHRARQQLALNDSIDQTHLQRLRSLDRPARDTHLDRRGHTNESRQTLRPLGARNDPKIHLGCAQRSIRNSHAIMPRHRDLQAPAQSHAVDRHDHRLRAILDPGQQRMQVRGRSRIPGRLFQFLDIGPGDERSAPAYQHNGANRGIALGCFESRPNAFRHSGAKRIHGRIVDGNDSHPVATGEGARGETDSLGHQKSVTLSYGAEATAISDDTPHSG